MHYLPMAVSLFLGLVLGFMGGSVCWGQMLGVRAGAQRSVPDCMASIGAPCLRPSLNLQMIILVCHTQVQAGASNWLLPASS